MPRSRISRHFGVTFARGVFQLHLTGATGVSPPHVTNGTTRRAHLASQMGFAASRPRSGPSPHPTSAAAAAAEPLGAAQPAGRAAGDVLDGVEECRWALCADIRRLSPRYRPAERQRPRSRPARARRSGWWQAGLGGVGWGAGQGPRGGGLGGYPASLHSQQGPADRKKPRAVAPAATQPFCATFSPLTMAG